MRGKDLERDTSLSVFVTSAYPEEEPIASFLQAATQDRFGTHRLTENAHDADMIFFIEPNRWIAERDYRDLRAHPLVRKYREKCFMYCDDDRPWCVLPGVYCSMPRWLFNHRRQRACSYIRTRNPFVSHDDLTPDLLFSFIGKDNWPVRRAIYNLSHPRSITEETLRHYNIHVHKLRKTESDYPLTHYAEVMSRSKFVLCPRGQGTSSYRIFETLKAGRVPVILSDQWVEPDGPDWSTFSLRMPEKEVDQLPGRLEAIEDQWPVMAKAATQAWNTWFAEDVLFHRMIESCIDIQRSRRWPESVSQRIPQPGYMKHRLGAFARSAESFVKTRGKKG